jgi:hypothetical protein
MLHKKAAQAAFLAIEAPCAAMKALTFWLALVATLTVASSAATETVQVLIVEATIAPVCRFFGAASPSVRLTNTGASGEIDPRLSTPATGNAQIAYRCSAGTAPNFGIPQTATLACPTCAAPSTLDVALSWTNAGGGVGMTDAGNRTLNLTAQVPPSSFQAAAPGDYVGSVTVTVSP